MKNLLKKLGIVNMPSFWKFILQFIKFGLVGLSNTAISLGIYYLLIFFGINYIIANSIGFIISVLNAFFWNSRYVFNSSQKENQDSDGKVKNKTLLVKSFIAYGITFIISTFLLYLMVDIINISEAIAPLINLAVTVPLNFLLNRFWVYKNK